MPWASEKCAENCAAELRAELRGAHFDSAASMRERASDARASAVMRSVSARSHTSWIRCFSFTASFATRSAAILASASSSARRSAAFTRVSSSLTRSRFSTDSTWAYCPSIFLRIGGSVTSRSLFSLSTFFSAILISFFDCHII